MKEVFILDKKKAINNFDDLMNFQYGNKEESDKAFERLQDIDKKLFVVCGSIKKNRFTFKLWKDRLEWLQHKVIIPFDVPFPRVKAPFELRVEQKTANRNFYYKAIDECYAIVVNNDNDYVGVETSMEIGYAYARDKNIFITNTKSKIDGIASLLDEGKAIDINELFMIEKLKENK